MDAFVEPEREENHSNRRNDEQHHPQVMVIPREDFWMREGPTHEADPKDRNSNECEPEQLAAKQDKHHNEVG
ncbi:MAG: hypothetical protein HC869_25605 [Rhodospirillales bacterium]|nr:hypothetical protein [Rhodospirillales bacterium]